MYAFNAQFYDIQAQDAIRRGDVEAIKYGQQARKFQGSQKAMLAAQGIDVSSGSALDIQNETSRIAVEDMRNIRNNAWREAFGFKAQAEQANIQGNMAYSTAQVQAKQTMVAGGISSISQGLKGYADYYQYSNRRSSAVTEG